MHTAATMLYSADSDGTLALLKSVVDEGGCVTLGRRDCMAEAERRQLSSPLRYQKISRKVFELRAPAAPAAGIAELKVLSRTRIEIQAIVGTEKSLVAAAASSGDHAWQQLQQGQQVTLQQPTLIRLTAKPLLWLVTAAAAAPIQSVLDETILLPPAEQLPPELAAATQPLPASQPLSFPHEAQQTPVLAAAASEQLAATVPVELLLSQNLSQASHGQGSDSKSLPSAAQAEAEAEAGVVEEEVGSISGDSQSSGRISPTSSRDACSEAEEAEGEWSADERLTAAAEAAWRSAVVMGPAMLVPTLSAQSQPLAPASARENSPAIGSQQQPGGEGAIAAVAAPAPAPAADAPAVNALSASHSVTMCIRICSVCARPAAAASTDLSEGTRAVVSAVTCGPLAGELAVQCRDFHETLSSESGSGSPREAQLYTVGYLARNGVDAVQAALWPEVAAAAAEPMQWPPPPPAPGAAVGSTVASAWPLAHAITNAYATRVQRRQGRGKQAGTVFRAWLCMQVSLPPSLPAAEVAARLRALSSSATALSARGYHDLMVVSPGQ